MNMGKAVIKIPYVTWRDGRPRFIPSPKYRELGFKGMDLRHGKDGAWFTVEQCMRWSEDFAIELDQAKKNAPKSPKGKQPRVGRSGLSIAHILTRWFEEHPKFHDKPVIEGRKVRKPLSPKTVAYYHQGAKCLERFDDGFVWASPIEDLTPKACEEIIDHIERQHGLAMARCVRATISASWKWAKKKWSLQDNPTTQVELPTLPPRRRFATIEEYLAMLDAADELGLPEIGDMIVLGVWTGQRQNDRLSLTTGQIKQDCIHYFVNKKDQRELIISIAPQLRSRLEAARTRRMQKNLLFTHAVLNEATWAPFVHHTYRKLYAKVRAHAAKSCPSVKTLRDQDLRDTCATWLREAKCTATELEAFLDHTIETNAVTKNHYLGTYKSRTVEAVKKLDSWFNAQLQALGQDAGASS